MEELTRRRFPGSAAVPERRRRSPRRVLGMASALLAAGALLPACTAGAPAARIVSTPTAQPGSAQAGGSPGAIALTTDMQSCGSQWSAPGGGRLTFAVTNAFQDAMNVYLTDAKTGAMYLELEGIGADATLDGSVVLGNGSYHFECFPNDADPVTGPTVTIAGAGAVKDPTAGVIPITTTQLIDPSVKYHQWVASRLPALKSQVAKLAADVAAGPTAQAKADWLAAHETYETLGAAYDAFGELDAGINGAPTAGVNPATDPRLTGFHKLEALLWQGAPAQKLQPSANELVSTVGKLISAWPQFRINPSDVPLRAHEIVENAIQFELDATTDAGSHTELANIDANLYGAQQALQPIASLYTSRYPRLQRTRQALAASKTLVETYDKNGAWTPLTALTRTQREALNASLQNTVELLAPIAAIGDPRQVPEQ